MENGNNREGTPDSPNVPRSRSRSHSHQRSRKQASRSRSRSKSREHRRKKRGSESPRRSHYPQGHYNQGFGNRGYGSEMRGRSYGGGYNPRFNGRARGGYSNYNNGHSNDHIRETPPEGRCLGVFGLCVETTPKKLEHVFGEFGGLEDVQMVYDAKTGRSRGFAFIYFESINSAKHAREKLNGIEIDGRKIRVDYSLTQHAHTPTPGVYMGRNGSSTTRYRSNYYGSGGHNSRYNDYPRDHERDRYHPQIKRRFSRSRSRSPRKGYHSYGDDKAYRGRNYPSGFKEEYSRY